MIGACEIDYNKCKCSDPTPGPCGCPHCPAHGPDVLKHEVQKFCEWKDTQSCSSGAGGGGSGGGGGGGGGGGSHHGSHNRNKSKANRNFSFSAVFFNPFTLLAVLFAMLLVMGSMIRYREVCISKSRRLFFVLTFLLIHNFVLTGR